MQVPNWIGIPAALVVMVSLFLAFNPDIAHKKIVLGNTANTHQYVFKTPNVARRNEARMQDTRRLCDKPYPGPDGKADCEMAKKLLANPHYIKM